MTKQMKLTPVKRLISIFIAVAMILSVFAGCGKTQNETAVPETSKVPVPEEKKPVPNDLFSDQLNIFAGTIFPQGYTVYAAGFEDNVDFCYYVLYLTAQGSPEDVIAYVTTLLGIDSEESVRQAIDTFRRDGGVGIDGKLGESGLTVNCKITPIEADNNDYDYVEGCCLRFRAEIVDPTDYREIMAGNYNLGSLADVANYFDVTPITGKSSIYVRRNQNDAKIEAVYNTVEDVALVMERMKAELKYAYFDENDNMGLPSYGEVKNSFFFDINNNSISIFQSLGDAGKNYQDYEPASTKLTELGFSNYIEPDALCEYKDEAQNLSIVINIPQWGGRPDEWENSCVMFMKDMNGYALAIWYYSDEGKYVVQADKDDSSAKYTYNAKTGKFSEEYPNPDAVKAQFMNLFPDAAQTDIYMQSIELFQNYVSETFGMSIDELYATAAIEQ